MENTNQGYLYLFDFTYPAIYEIELSYEDGDKDIDDILKEYGLSTEICEYMYSQNKLNIEPIQKEEK
jgi:hypothetical protein